MSYHPRCVLLTGGAGFIGSNALIYFVEKYPDVTWICLDKLDYSASLKNLSSIKDKSNFLFVKGDVTSADLVNHLIESHDVDTILHFAAQTHVDNSFGNSLTFTLANVLGTHTLLESAKLFRDRIRRFVHVSTDEVYGESSLSTDSASFDEKSAMNPSNPYAATKAAAEFLVKSYHQSFRLPVIITRGNNVFGPRQYPEKLIPKFIHLLERNLPCPIHGDGSHRRSFIYVEDVARAFDVVLHSGHVGQVYNIGTQFEISNLEVARTLLQHYQIADQEEKYLLFVDDRSWNDVRYHINIDKLQLLGWSPLVTFAEGLKRTVEWYKANLDHWENVASALVPHPRGGVEIAEPRFK